MQQPWPLAARERVVGCRRLGECLVEGPGDHRVDDRVDLLDPLDVRGDDLAGRYLAAADQGGEGDRVAAARVSHRAGSLTCLAVPNSGGPRPPRRSAMGGGGWRWGGVRWSSWLWNAGGSRCAG